MFRLVGSEVFNVGHYECKLDVEPDGAFGLNYVLSIDGQILDQFLESYKKKHVTWTVDLSTGKTHTIVLGKANINRTQLWPQIFNPSLPLF